jgi:hypothetical protein
VFLFFFIKRNGILVHVWLFWPPEDKVASRMVLLQNRNMRRRMALFHQFLPPFCRVGIKKKRDFFSSFFPPSENLLTGRCAQLLLNFFVGSYSFESTLCVELPFEIGRRRRRGQLLLSVPPSFFFLLLLLLFASNSLISNG